MTGLGGSRPPSGTRDAAATRPTMTEQAGGGTGTPRRHAGARKARRPRGRHGDDPKACGRRGRPGDGTGGPETPPRTVMGVRKTLLRVAGRHGRPEGGGRRARRRCGEHKGGTGCTEGYGDAPKAVRGARRRCGSVIRRPGDGTGGPKERGSAGGLSGGGRRDPGAAGQRPPYRFSCRRGQPAALLVERRTENGPEPQPSYDARRQDHTRRSQPRAPGGTAGGRAVPRRSANRRSSRGGRRARGSGVRLRRRHGTTAVIRPA